MARSCLQTRRHRRLRSAPAQGRRRVRQSGGGNCRCGGVTRQGLPREGWLRPPAGRVSEDLVGELESCARGTPPEHESTPGGPKFGNVRSRPTDVLSSQDRKSTRLNSSHGYISYAVFCLKKKNNKNKIDRVI